MQFYSYLLIQRIGTNDLPIGAYPTLQEAEEMLVLWPEANARIMDLFSVGHWSEGELSTTCYLVVKLDRGETVGGWCYREKGGKWERLKTFANTDHDEPATIPVTPRPMPYYE